MQIRIDAYGDFFNDLESLHKGMVTAKGLAGEVRELVAIVFDGPKGRLIPREEVEKFSKFRGWLFETYRLPLRRRLAPSNWGKLLCVPNSRVPLLNPVHEPKVANLVHALRKARVFSKGEEGFIFIDERDIPDLEIARMVLRHEVEDLEAAKTFLYPYSFKDM